ncbi:LysR family transcriptional regulator [Granulicella tundricola]|uniref:Transcriptional regulator, LysR family n=1 Tax=Granulicella tundricola (strain ATCC BAA-1859 / DSM 23138 / MP5ACTX9) TaxID=1198114 RepID=E8WWC7_GRATM|nr:LysR substrate-binding domain-containing protein [Granulicella tundricola]ADW68510.1 transcriptional regulator, LysR family [Granulicella tundricola MP5ACTX9]
MSLTVETRLQLAAITLADELNFTRAAERLKITQPALSKQIAELEGRVGFTIFKRTQKKVELTDAGQVFVRGCKDALALFEKSLRLARATHEEVLPVLTVGHSPYIDPGLVSALLSVHLPLHPDLRLRMESMFALDLAHAVVAAELDLAIITEPSDNPLLTNVLIATAPLCIAMPADHPAAHRRSVTMQDLAGIGWIIFSRRTHPKIYERVLEVGRQAGISPVELHHYLGAQEVVQLITENLGVAFVPKGVSDTMQSQEIAVRPLSEAALQVRSYLVLRADESSRLVNEFGRAFLRKVIPNGNIVDSSGQMRLGL